MENSVTAVTKKNTIKPHIFNIRGPRLHHLLSDEVRDQRILRRSRNTWNRWRPAGFERAIVYGAMVWWGNRDNNKFLIKILRSTQRPFALAICRGYNTLSTDAALFLSGLIPIELVSNFESKITSLNRPMNILKIGPNSNVIDIPSLNYFCDPADYEIINFTK
ncbi:hypothetical protein LAZ67_16002415 [Cordylochernes scorpioides]|uniref:Uncharacterized protein n=1 Tax=Cordylochernes scorpioides TaxID=51811 RepID=A0ABY6LEQ0_9ARAC|nr:hypothetical protein LAZ67_16002415 [Cordylochernes scorpioides]